jgi:hypothetical protein
MLAMVHIMPISSRQISEFYCPLSAVSERRLTARQISQKEQNLSVLRRQIDESISIAFSSSKSTLLRADVQMERL